MSWWRGPRGLGVVAVLVVSTAAQAQPATDAFGIERFRLAMDRAGVLDVESAEVAGHLSVSASAFVGFAHDPLVVYDRDMNAVDALVDRRLTTSPESTVRSASCRLPRHNCSSQRQVGTQR